MLDESRQSARPLRTNEIALLAVLLGESASAVESQLRERLVEEVADGGMGGVRFLPRTDTPRLFGRRAAEAEFTDADGVTVIVSLNLDEQGDLYELDFWKSDFSPLRSYPETGQLASLTTM